MSAQPASRVVAILALCSLSFAGHALAQEAAAPAVALRAGLFVPSDGAFRDVYGGARIPVFVQLDWPVHRRVALFGAIRYVRMSGQPVPVGAVAFSEGDAGTARLRVASMRAGALLLLPSGSWDLRLGGGLSVDGYSEEWRATDAQASGTRSGWLAQAGIWRRLGRRLGVGGTLEYSSVTVPASDETLEVKLGGLELSGGVSVRF
jgi:hypothetical protein